MEKRLRHIPSGRARAIVRSGVKRVEIMLGTLVDINVKATNDYSSNEFNNSVWETLQKSAIVKA